MKTIGVIGGIGPQATMDFEVRFHAVCQRLIPQHGNSGYPPLIVHYLRVPPVVVDERLRPVPPLRPSSGLLDAARALGPQVDFLVMTANGPHAFADQVEAAAGRPVLSMVALALDEVAARRPAKVGLLGLGLPTIYGAPLAAAGQPTVTLTEPARDRLDQAILAVMEGRNGSVDQQAALDAVSYLRDEGAEAIILGCTELPMLLGGYQQAADFINPAQLLAEAAVVRALDGG